MTIESPEKLKRRIRVLIIIFMVCLLISGLTAFPVETELNYLRQYFSSTSSMGKWINQTYEAVSATNNAYPSLAYGTDWLAFAHIILTILFIGPLIDPVRNIWIIQFAMISCVLVIPLAFIAGQIRSIPFFWQLIDCSFGVLGLIPLTICYRWIRELERIRYGI